MLERFPVHGPQVNASSLLSVKRVLIGENTFTGGDSIHQGSFSRQLREMGSSNWFECGISSEWESLSPSERQFVMSDINSMLIISQS